MQTLCLTYWSKWLKLSSLIPKPACVQPTPLHTHTHTHTPQHECLRRHKDMKPRERYKVPCRWISAAFYINREVAVWFQTISDKMVAWWSCPKPRSIPPPTALLSFSFSFSLEFFPCRFRSHELSFTKYLLSIFVLETSFSLTLPSFYGAQILFKRLTVSSPVSFLFSLGWFS